MYFDVFSILFSCITNLIFVYDRCYGISSDRKVLSSKYVVNVDVRVDRSSDYLGFHLSLLLHLDLCRRCVDITPNSIDHEGLHD